MPLPHQPKPKKYETCRQYVHSNYGRDTENTIDRGASVPHVPILSSHSQSRPLPFSPNSAKKWTVSHTLDFLRLALLASRRSLRFEDSYREHYAATTFSPLYTCVACVELSASSVPMVAYREHKLAPFLDGIKRGPRKRSFLLSSPFAHFF